MIHRKKDRVVSIGELIKEGPALGRKDSVLTEFRMEQPVGLSTFAVGPYEIHKDIAKEDNGKQLPHPVLLDAWGLGSHQRGLHPC